MGAFFGGLGLGIVFVFIVLLTGAKLHEAGKWPFNKV